MKAKLDRLISLSIQLHVQIWSALERLEARTDGEALHDLRIVLRRLRSLIRPFKRWPSADYLDRALKAVADQSGSLRDHEVLLHALGEQASEQWRRQTLAQLDLGYRQLLRSQALKTLKAALDTWPSDIRQLERDGELADLQGLISRSLRKQAQRLREAIATPDLDRHQLRLLVKKLHYTLAAYPSDVVFEKRLLPVLKSAQGWLGDWHDRWQWMQLAEQEPELLVFLPVWQEQMQQALLQAEQVIERLPPLLVYSSE